MKEIKTKPARVKPHVLDKAETVPKTAMKEMWLHAKEKTLRETMNSPFYSEQDATGNAPCQYCRGSDVVWCGNCSRKGN